MTFLESTLNKPINNYIRVDIKRSDPQLIDNNSNEKEEGFKDNAGKKQSKRRQLEAEKTLRPIYFDQDENKTYTDYIAKGPMIIDKNAEYHRKLSQPDSDVNALTSTYYGHLNPIYKENDLLQIVDIEKQNLEDIEHDKEIINRYISFDSINHLYIR